jgi:cell division protein FtsL
MENLNFIIAGVFLGLFASLIIFFVIDLFRTRAKVKRLEVNLKNQETMSEYLDKRIDELTNDRVKDQSDMFDYIHNQLNSLTLKEPEDKVTGPINS